MFNRLLMIFLSTLSLAWIFFVGYDVFYKTDRLNPELIFSAQDEELLIINRTDEFFQAELPFEIHAAIAPLVHQLIDNPRNERIFLSKNRPIIVVESPHYWNKQSVIRYLERKEIAHSSDGKRLLIGDKEVKFKYHFMLIAPTDFKKSNSEFAFPNWDKKASSVLIHDLEGSPYLTEVYTSETGQITYQTIFDNRLEGSKIDDKNVFAPYLPSTISTYHFYEKSYALAKNILSDKSPMVEWLSYGFVVFDYQGTPILMTDSKVGEDPLNTLNIRYGKDGETLSENTLVKGVKLTETFPASTSKGFYMTRVGDKVLFSDNLDVNKKVVADYELGNTLLLNAEKATYFYGKLPYKVVERNISTTNYYAISTFENIATKYAFATSGTENVPPVSNDDSEAAHFIIPVSASIVQTIGKGNQQYLLTAENELIAINNGKIVWKQALSGALIGEVKIVDYEGTGKVYLLANTAQQVFLFSESGTNVLENKVKPATAFNNEVNLYRWKNQTHLIYSDQTGIVKNWNATSNRANTVKVSAGNASQKIEVFAQNGRLIGLYMGAENTETLDLDKFKAVKKHPAISNDAVRYKSKGIVYFVAFQEEKLERLEYNSAKQTVGTFPEIQQLRIVELETATYFTLISKDVLYIYNEDATLHKKIAVPSRDVQDYDIAIFQNKLYVTFLDGLENKIILTDTNGSVIRRNLEGKHSVFLSVSKGNLNVLTEGNGYAVQYYNVKSE